MFSPTPPMVMHIDLNSCFATVEQQANPFLRGKPVAVAAYTTPRGCVLAASREAKYEFGVKTGMRVGDAKALCPELIVLPTDPNKYRFVNRRLLSILQGYSDDIEVKSIDEMVIDFSHAPLLRKKLLVHTCLSARQGSQFTENRLNGKKITNNQASIIKQYLNPNTKIQNNVFIDYLIFEFVCNLYIGYWNLDDCKYHFTVEIMEQIAQEIKIRIKKEIGEWLTASIGIGPNRFLAKTASNLHKPDGLDVIHKDNIEEIFRDMPVEKLTGIKEGNGTKLRRFGITTVLLMFQASDRMLKSAFQSVNGYYWYQRLHGWEIDTIPWKKKSIGHSYSLYEPYETDDRRLLQILCQLTEKMGRRLRNGGYSAQGIHLGCLFSDYSYWHKGIKLAVPLYANTDLFSAACRVLSESPHKPVRVLSVHAYFLTKQTSEQLSFDGGENRKRNLTHAIDKIHNRWGESMVTSGRMLGTPQKIKDRIAFGGVKELEEFVFRDTISREGDGEDIYCAT